MDVIDFFFVVVVALCEFSYTTTRVVFIRLHTKKGITCTSVIASTVEKSYKLNPAQRIYLDHIALDPEI